MNRNKYHIINAWILLFCFAAGQYIVYAHQHKLVKTSITSSSYSINKAHPQQTVTEKCRLCDAMHHTNMVLNGTAAFNVLVVADHTFKCVEYKFTGVALIHAGGRSPPFSSYSC